ncbi:hypothetical protein HYV21_00745 [Candidatus Microgenomates bacterium]|nr:hypothetical protein [Candidatus Microgenomates bacterium]
MQKKYALVRKIYLYAFSFIGLLLIVIGLVRLVDLGLKVYVFTKADTYGVYPAPRAVQVTPEGKEIVMSEEEQERYKREQEEAEKTNRESQRQRDASNSLAMIIIGAPLFFYHWRIISRERD